MVADLLNRSRSLFVSDQQTALLTNLQQQLEAIQDQSMAQEAQAAQTAHENPAMELDTEEHLDLERMVDEFLREAHRTPPATPQATPATPQQPTVFQDAGEAMALAAAAEFRKRVRQSFLDASMKRKRLERE